jgi:hypothetical protein
LFDIRTPKAASCSIVKIHWRIKDYAGADP